MAPTIIVERYDPTKPPQETTKDMHSKQKRGRNDLDKEERDILHSRTKSNKKKKRSRHNKEHQSSTATEAKKDVVGKHKMVKPMQDDPVSAETDFLTSNNTLDDEQSLDAESKEPEPVENIIHEIEGLHAEEEEDHNEEENEEQDRDSHLPSVSPMDDHGVVEPTPQEIQTALHVSTLPLKQVAEAWKMAPFLIRNLERDGFTSFFPIQALSIPDTITWEQQLRGRLQHEVQDVCITAPTGSGKTLSYVLPIVNALSQRRVPRLTALVILPMRDLAQQVHSVFEKYVRHSNLRVGLAVGQSDWEAEQMAFRTSASHNGSETPTAASLDFDTHLSQFSSPPTNALSIHDNVIDILVCTPGRLIDHMDSTPGFSLRHLRFLVVDEADRLLSERYQNWIDRVLHQVEYGNQTDQGTNATLLSSSSFLDPNTWRRNDLVQTPSSSSSWSNETGSPRQFGRIPEVRRPVQLRKYLVSATMTRDPRKLQSLRLVNPKLFNVHRLSITTTTATLNNKAHNSSSNKFALPPLLEEYTVECTMEQKPLVLCVALLQHLEQQQQREDGPKQGLAFVFTSSVESSHRLTRLLQLLVWAMQEAETTTTTTTSLDRPSSCVSQLQVAEFSSALSQTDRSQLIQDCREPSSTESKSNRRRRPSVVVCSDGMSRGIDLDTITLVVNYNIPRYARTYVHRCGRTARAGKSGQALTLVPPNDSVRRLAKLRKEIAEPDRVQSWKEDNTANTKDASSYQRWARTVARHYRKCLANLREVLEAEEHGDLEPTQEIPSYLLTSSDLS